jgi:hypothetical protein
MGKLVDEASGNGLGGIPRRTLMERLVTRKEPLRAVMKHLGHQHVDDYKEASCEELEQQAHLAAKFYVDTWPKGSKPKLVDVVLKAVLEAPLDASEVHRIFGGVSLERDLTGPVEAHLTAAGLTVEREMPAGERCADLVGYGETGFFIRSRKCVAVELKNKPEECDRLAAQVTAYGRVATVVRVLMTPECLARLSLRRGELASPGAFKEHIEKLRAELWLYDATAKTFHQLTENISSKCVELEANAFWASLLARRAAAQPVPSK